MDRRHAIRSQAALAAIWRAVRAIPRGEVATYGSIARRAGLPGRARLVGYALKAAPPALELPWHRVVGAGGRIAFARQSRSYAQQARRLEAEGVRLAAGRVMSETRRTLDELLWKPRGRGSPRAGSLRRAKGARSTERSRRAAQAQRGRLQRRGRTR